LTHGSKSSFSHGSQKVQVMAAGCMSTHGSSANKHAMFLSLRGDIYILQKRNIVYNFELDSDAHHETIPHDYHLCLWASFSRLTKLFWWTAEWTCWIALACMKTVSHATLMASALSQTSPIF
jgi:hypothetical protein